MEEMKKEEAIVESIIVWFEEHKREFTWRIDKNPYYIMLSEIMSQQTQMSRVVPYFERFIKHFPTIQDLANANEADVLKLWEGLGYYSRARNLHKAARMICDSYNGVIPNRFDDLIKLPGFGMYTSAAVASFAYGEHVSAIDGNVCRVYTRLFADDRDISKDTTKKSIKEAIESFMPKDQSAVLNESFIEYGALVCTPKNPLCETCPLQHQCAAFDLGLVDIFPVKKQSAEKKHIPYYVFRIINSKGELYSVCETETRLLHGMYKLPKFDAREYTYEAAQMEVLTNLDIEVKEVHYVGVTRHVFSHMIWEYEVYDFYIDNENEEHAQNFHYPEDIPIANAYRKIIDLTKTTRI